MMHSCVLDGIHLATYHTKRRGYLGPLGMHRFLAKASATFSGCSGICGCILLEVTIYFWHSA